MKLLNTKVGLPNFVPTSAWLEHGPFAMWLVRRLRPRRIVELGTHYGFSYFAMCQAVAEDNLPTQCFAVDTWQGDEHAGFYDDSVFDGVQQENQKYKHFSTLLRKTFSDALQDIENESVDLLHVDGRHFYDDVKEDFETWIPKLSNSAVVLFHDTEVYDRNFGVHQYWEELSSVRPSLNFLHGHGLGVLLWGPNVTDDVQDVLNAKGRSSIRHDFLLDYFSAAGKSFVQLHQLACIVSEHECKQRKLEAMLADSDRNLLRLESQLATAQLEILKAQAASGRPVRQMRRILVNKLLSFVSAIGVPIPEQLTRRLHQRTEKKDCQGS